MPLFPPNLLPSENGRIYISDSRAIQLEVGWCQWCFLCFLCMEFTFPADSDLLLGSTRQTCLPPDLPVFAVGEGSYSEVLTLKLHNLRGIGLCLDYTN